VGSKTPPPRGTKTKKSPSRFPKLKETPALDDGTEEIKYHNWSFSREGVDKASGLCVCSSHVKDSVDDPKESVLSTRAILPVGNKTMLVEQWQKFVYAGFCLDDQKHPAIWIKMPRTLETPLENGMKDLKAICMLADILFDGDNTAMNEEMKNHYIEAFDQDNLSDFIVHVITLPNLSFQEDDDDDGDTKNNWYFSNDKFNNYPDKNKQLTIKPSEHQLKPVMYVPQGGKTVKNLKGTMAVANGYVMVQVYVEGSQRKLTVAHETDDAGDNGDYMDEIAKQIHQQLNVSTGMN